ncbi:MAG: NAD-dependent epimerase/dehydratase family protein [Candidatus Woesearchaeota archaeon]
MHVKKKIILTGAAGEVGMNILAILKESGEIKKYDIIAIDKNSNNLNLLKKLFPSVTVVNADLADSKNITAWDKHFKDAYAVIQLQAQISSPEYDAYKKNNIDSIRLVVDACKSAGVKNLIHASSSVVISVAKDGYTKSKRVGEKIVANSKIPHTILRPTLMYGCFDIKHLNYLIRMFEKYPVFLMPGSGKYIRQPLFVEDFANIIISCINRKPHNNAYNISGKEKIYLIDCLKMIYAARKKRKLFIKVPLPIFYVMIKIYGFLNRKTRIIPDQLTALTAGDIFPVIDWERIFSVKPTSYRDGINKTVHSKYYNYDAKMVRLSD